MAADEAGRLARQSALEVLSQGPKPTCGPVSCAIVIRRLGGWGHQDDIITIARQKGWLTNEGMYRADLVKLLAEKVVRSEEVTEATIDILRQATNGRKLAIVRYKPGNAGGRGHFVVVDGITRRFDPSAKAIVDVVAVTNPHGTQYYLPVSEFLKIWDNSLIRLLD